MKMNRLTVRKIVKRVKRMFHKKTTQEELDYQKQKSDYEYLIKNGVETKCGYVTLNGYPIIIKEPGSRIVIGKGVVLTSETESNPAGINHPVILATYSKQSEIIIHDGVGMSGTSVNCVQSCEFCECAMLGANTNVWDTDFHPVDPEKRLVQQSIMDAASAPIKIGKNVWLGAGTTVLKGVTIGENTVVGAMSLVTRDLDSNAVYAGVPAKIIKDIESSLYRM